MKKTILLLTTSMIILLSVIVSHGKEKVKEITLAEAISIAAETIPGEVVRAERERGLYEVKIRTGDGKTEKVYLDAFTGKAVNKKILSVDDATTVATRGFPGEIIKVEFEKGRYEIRIRTADGIGKEVYVDGETGEIIKVKTGERYGR